ncbi:hypothetical protein ACJ41O_001545 [Fusarium nematophilum]
MTVINVPLARYISLDSRMALGKALTLGIIAASSLFGVDAGPCRASISQTLSSLTSSETLSSIALSVTTDSTTATAETLASETTTSETETKTSETTIISEITTTTATTEATMSTETTITTETTTTSAEVCTATNIVENPGFDEPDTNGADTGAPWTFGGNVFLGSKYPRSPQHYVGFFPVNNDQSLSQDVPELEAENAYTISYYWARGGNIQESYNCRITVSAGVLLDTLLVGSGPAVTYEKHEINVVAGTITSSTLEILGTCDGTASLVALYVDDVSVVRDCRRIEK